MFIDTSLPSSDNTIYGSSVLFPTAYQYESGFSALVAIKIKSGNGFNVKDIVHISVLLQFQLLFFKKNKSRLSLT